jgi:hypothetical protein
VCQVELNTGCSRIKCVVELTIAEDWEELKIVQLSIILVSATLHTHLVLYYFLVKHDRELTVC